MPERPLIPTTTTKATTSKSKNGGKKNDVKERAKVQPAKELCKGSKRSAHSNTVR